MLARTEVECNGEKHHISAWEPGDEEQCDADHVVYGPKGYIICYEDHDAEIDLTITDMTGEMCGCFEWADYASHHFFKETSKLYLDINPDIIIIAACCGATMNRAHGFSSDKAGDVAMYWIASESAKLSPERSLYVAKILMDHLIFSAKTISTAMRWAASHGKYQLTEYLLDLGADIHDYQDYALRQSYVYRHKDTMLMLLERGADENMLNMKQEYLDPSESHLEVKKAVDAFLDKKYRGTHE
ncbi:MAG: hypothetical protein WCV79_04150 [Candidatus Paceibacterota bacterium]|jgi:hypothetical protein